jgi:hypothetical protein
MATRMIISETPTTMDATPMTKGYVGLHLPHAVLRTRCARGRVGGPHAEQSLLPLCAGESHCPREDTMTDGMDGAAEVRRQKYGHLPSPVRIEDTVTSQETDPARDPEGGRDTDRDFMIRHAGG